MKIKYAVKKGNKVAWYSDYYLSVADARLYGSVVESYIILGNGLFEKIK